MMDSSAKKAVKICLSIFLFMLSVFVYGLCFHLIGKESLRLVFEEIRRYAPYSLIAIPPLCWFTWFASIFACQITLAFCALPFFISLGGRHSEMEHG